MKTLTISIIILLAMSAPIFAGGNKETTPEPENTMMMVQAQQPQDTAAEALISYQNFDQAKMIAAEAPTVLFFHASWCPTCRSAREEFNKRQSEFKYINLILVDYDNSNDLKKMYGVTYQHTFVQIDENGDALAKWNGGDVEKLLSNVIMEDES
ncbi:MAG: thioredoxin family protein [Sphaerochaetaceae bacterium]|nr:thioredoxin family protein [Sphaerochaetaceae bacterium]